MVEMKEEDLRELKKRGYDLKDLNELSNEEQEIYYPKKKKKMKKKNVGYILFGVGASGFLSTLLLSFINMARINRSLEELEDLGYSDEFPIRFLKALPLITIIIGAVTTLILFCVGVILLIKFRERKNNSINNSS